MHQPPFRAFGGLTFLSASYLGRAMLSVRRLVVEGGRRVRAEAEEVEEDWAAKKNVWWSRLG